MLGPTSNLIFKNRKMYIKLYTIWHCDFVEKKRNLNESAIRLVFGFAFLGKLATNPLVARDNYFYGGFIKFFFTI